MKVKCIDVSNTDPQWAVDLTLGKIYDAEVELIKDSFCPLYRVVDDSGEDYLYDPRRFEVMRP